MLKRGNASRASEGEVMSKGRGGTFLFSSPRSLEVSFCSHAFQRGIYPFFVPRTVVGRPHTPAANPGGLATGRRNPRGYSQMRNSCDEIQADRTRGHFYPSGPSFQLSLAALSSGLGKLMPKSAAKRRGSRANFLPPRDRPSKPTDGSVWEMHSSNHPLFVF